MRILTFIMMLTLIIPINSYALDLIMVRSKQKFPEAMLTLQTSIVEHGYHLTRVQRIDIGLTGMGYKTDKYRVVFLGKYDEFKYLIKKYPELIAYLLPKVSIFAEGDSTMLVTANPTLYINQVKEEDKNLFRRWESDIYSVFDDIRKAE